MFKCIHYSIRLTWNHCVVLDLGGSVVCFCVLFMIILHQLFMEFTEWDGNHYVKTFISPVESRVSKALLEMNQL